MIVDFAHERFIRSPNADVTYDIILRAISEAMVSQFPTRDQQRSAFGETLMISIDLVHGTITVSPQPAPS